MGDLTTNFSKKEFACPCGCGFDRPADRLLTRLQSTRNKAGIPLAITSGCRCSTHNEAVGGVDTSAHLTGEGVDVSTPDSRTRFKVIDAALRSGITRIGIGQSFVHLDVRNNERQQPQLIWTYYSKPGKRSKPVTKTA